MIPGGNLGNVSALGEGPRHAGRARPGRPPAAHRLRAGRGREPALPRSYQRGFEMFEPIAARPTLAQRDPDRQSGLDRQGDRRAPPLRRHRRAGERAGARRGRARAPTAPACSTARTRAWRSPRSRSSSTRGVIRKSDRRGRDLDRARPQVRRLQGHATTRCRLASIESVLPTRRSSCPRTTRRCATDAARDRCALLKGERDELRPQPGARAGPRHRGGGSGLCPVHGSRRRDGRRSGGGRRHARRAEPHRHRKAPW